jgi:hypothetical protein
MTEPFKTVSDHLQEARAIVAERDTFSPSELARLRGHLEQAIEGIQLACCEARAGLDKL